ncbi:mannitol-1-phosphate 5-dehydrogenase [Litchfieldia salsa]|uniref:Mannitol-1-phosphate 5-dehydrogenase n=1 Tax=Litchfieldia salsa TaxID=930152 RepID=A0A1H0WAW0_9BACI|nr:mannitol-1-phosphate 5-dehydrogenase [Litchfieldia salsa]SDP87681.1 D-mannitol 1-phosphate 5-dehydrogenase [Litchfieldia salsa]
MLAVHFGAGNIGRGFIGSLLSKAGYEVCFVDVNAEVVNLLNEKKEYRVVLADENSQEETVKNVRAINSIQQPEEVLDAIASADLVTTAVGPNILPIIADSIAKGLRRRVEQTDQPLNIIACENMIGGSAFLKEKVYEKLSEAEKKQFDDQFAFPNAAVDRIVPNQTNEDKLMVSVEPFYEWVVDRSKLIGEVPTINGVTFVEDLAPFIERKLFTVNTGHAAAAYLGYQAGLETIKDAMEHEEVLQAVKDTLRETGTVLVRKYSFDYDEHMKYVNKIIGRFTNPFINDEIPRVARGPLRKLGQKDRLISPASQYYEFVEGQPVNLAKVIAAALKYDFPQDDEAVALQAKITELGFEKTIYDVCGLEECHPLVSLIMEKLNKR